MGKVIFPVWILMGIIYGGLLLPGVFHWPLWANFPSVVATLILFYYLDQWILTHEKTDSTDGT